MWGGEADVCETDTTKHSQLPLLTQTRTSGHPVLDEGSPAPTARLIFANNVSLARVFARADRRAVAATACSSSSVSSSTGGSAMGTGRDTRRAATTTAAKHAGLDRQQSPLPLSTAAAATATAAAAVANKYKVALSTSAHRFGECKARTWWTQLPLLADLLLVGPACRPPHFRFLYRQGRVCVSNSP